jgi:hypothetical protein
MAVPRRILTVLVHAITLFETGDRKVPEAQNSITALLHYPAPGRPEAFATTGLVPGIVDGKLARFNPPLLLLKEAVQGPTDLSIAVTDRDDRNGLVAFLRRLAGTVAGSGGSEVAGQVPGLLRAAFREAMASGQMVIGGAKEDRIEVVAVGQLALRDGEKTSGKVTVDLTTPRELKRAGKPPIKPHGPNGSIELGLMWDAD